MRIAVCDDDPLELSRISSFLEGYKQEKKAPIIYSMFQSSTELLSTIKNWKYDLFLLDVLMPGVDLVIDILIETAPFSLKVRSSHLQ